MMHLLLHFVEIGLDFPKSATADVTEEGTHGLLMMLLCRLGPGSSDSWSSSSSGSSFSSEKRLLSVSVVTTREDCISFAETLIYLIK